MRSSRVLIVGFGSVARAVTPLLLQHFGWSPRQVAVVTADDSGKDVARALGIGFDVCPLREDNYTTVLQDKVSAGDIVLNLAVEVSTIALIEWCQKHDVFYLDTCVEPWAGGYAALGRPLVETTNSWLRNDVLARAGVGCSTCVIAHGANPGIVTHFVARALSGLAQSVGVDDGGLLAGLAQRLGVRVIHIAERDTQKDSHPYTAGEFANTWSGSGLLAEALQHAELSWGTHEGLAPAGATIMGDGASGSMVLGTPSVENRIRSWVPSVGEQNAYLITHHEAHSIGDLLSITSPNGREVYRPTVYYAYHPCDKTCESLEQWRKKSYLPPHAINVMVDSLVAGQDELGVLILSEQGGYWYGSVLALEEARALNQYSNATSMQVAASILGAIDWMLANPRAGVVEAEDMCSEHVLAVAMPYLGNVFGVSTNWMPGTGRNFSFDAFLENR